MNKSFVRANKEFTLTTEPVEDTIRVEYNGEVIAESDKTLLLRETRRVPVYYFPKEDVRQEFLKATDLSTLCPFKGDASYWTVRVGTKELENVAWSYLDPTDDVPEIAGYISFYWNRMDGWFANGERIHAPEREDVSDGVNPLMEWLLTEAWDAHSTADLIDKFNTCLVDNGIPIYRFRLIMQTLHPQLFARAFGWTRGETEVVEFDAEGGVVETEAYQNSPFAAIMDGNPGIRRRLDIPDPQLDYPVLAELRDDGITDYVAMPFTFSDGQINVFSIITDRPGGFSVTDLGYIYDIIPLLSRLVEMHYVRRTAVTLLDTYLGKQTGKRVLDGKIKRGDGDDLYSVIWFCDLRNSTALSETMARDDYMRMLNQFLESMATAVMEEGGEVLRYIGDAALAIFPITGDVGLATPEATRAASRAARNAVAKMEEVNRQREEDGEDAIGYGIGLHMGNVTYGNIGAPARLEFTVIGAAANEAARLESLTKVLPPPVVMSAKFNDCYAGKLASLGEHKLKDVADEQEVFTLPELLEGGS